MADDDAAYQREEDPLHCDCGDPLCHLPYAHLRADGRLRIKSNHHGRTHTNFVTVADLAARLGLRLVPVVAEGAPGPTLADAAAALGLRLVPLETPSAA